MHPCFVARSDELADILAKKVALVKKTFLDYIAFQKSRMAKKCFSAVASTDDHKGTPLPHATSFSLLLCSCLSFRSWMSLVVDFDQIFHVQMGVNLCRDEAFMSQKFLHTPNIRAAIQEMCSKTVP